MSNLNVDVILSLPFDKYQNNMREENRIGEILGIKKCIQEVVKMESESDVYTNFYEDVINRLDRLLAETRKVEIK
jgi:hypothetical protein